MLSVIMLSVIMLSAIMLCVIMLSVVMLSVIMLNVILLSVVMLTVVAPELNPCARARANNLSDIDGKKRILSDPANGTARIQSQISS